MRINKLFLVLGFLCLNIGAFLKVIDYACFDLSFYEKEYFSNSTAQSIGMSQDDLMNSTDTLLSYLKDNRDDIIYVARVKGEVREAFDERETLHMVDVKNLYQNRRC